MHILTDRIRRQVTDILSNLHLPPCPHRARGAVPLPAQRRERHAGAEEADGARGADGGVEASALHQAG